MRTSAGRNIMHTITIRNNTKNKRISVCDGVTKRRIIKLRDTVHLRGHKEDLYVFKILGDGMVMLVHSLTAELIITNVHKIVKTVGVAV